MNIPRLTAGLSTHTTNNMAKKGKKEEEYVKNFEVFKWEGKTYLIQGTSWEGTQVWIHNCCITIGKLLEEKFDIYGHPAYELHKNETTSNGRKTHPAYTESFKTFDEAVKKAIQLKYHS